MTISFLNNPLDLYEFLSLPNLKPIENLLIRLMEIPFRFFRNLIKKKTNKSLDRRFQTKYEVFNFSGGFVQHEKSGQELIFARIVKTTHCFICKSVISFFKHQKWRVYAS